MDDQILNPEYPQSTTPSAPRQVGPRATERRDYLLAALLLAACFLLSDSLLWSGGIGLGSALGLGLLLPVVAVYLRHTGKPRTVYGLFCGLLYLAAAASLALSGDIILKLLTLPVMHLLLILFILERTALRTGTGLRARLHDFFSAAFVISFGRLPQGCRALLRGSRDPQRRKHINGVLLGLFFAVPVLFLLVPLLISSDAAFEGLVNSMNWEAVGRGAWAILCGGIMTLLLFTLLFTSDRPRPGLGGGGFAGIAPATVAAFLGAIAFAYALYLAAQFAYFTSAFRGLLPKNFTLAEYARRGFFEMCWIVAINLALVVLATKLCRKPQGKLPGSVKGLALFLCGFSLVLVATALSKMFLYMGSLGLTRLRVLTSVFMLWLAALLVFTVVRLFVKRVPVLQLAVTTGAAVLLVLSLANVDGIVARYNIDAYRAGRLESLDMGTICCLGDGAVPAMAELLEDEDPKIARAAQAELRERLKTHGLAEHAQTGLLQAADAPTDLRSWNLVEQAARTALLQHRDELLPG